MPSCSQGTHLPSKISSLYGVLYVLEAGDEEVSKVFVSSILDYLVKYLGKKFELVHVAHVSVEMSIRQRTCARFQP